MDQALHHAAHGLDAERERRHVQQQFVIDSSRKYRRLHRGARLIAGAGVFGLGVIVAPLPQFV